MTQALNNLAELYLYFDNLVDNEVDADVLFASSYIRGFIALAASNYINQEVTEELQPLTQQIADDVSEQLKAAKNELTPQDQHIVQAFWQQLLPSFS